MTDNWWLYEDMDIYDGWCLKFNPQTKEIKWRDAWFVKRLSEEKKKEVEKRLWESLESGS